MVKLPYSSIAADGQSWLSLLVVLTWNSPPTAVPEALEPGTPVEPSVIDLDQGAQHGKT